jgi:hypothetical protein
VVFRDFPRTFELFELFDAHHQQDPHYYLKFTGVRPERQGTRSDRRVAELSFHLAHV